MFKAIAGNRFVSKLRYHFILAAIGIIVFHAWFSANIFSFSDLWFYNTETLRGFLTVNLWANNSRFGGVDITIWRLPLNLIYGWGSLFGLNSAQTGKVLVLWPTAILPSLAMFILLKRLLHNDLASIIGALVFAYNTYFLAIDTQGHMLLIVGYSLGVIGLYCCERALSKNGANYWLATALTLFVAGAYDLRSMYLSMAIVIIYIGYSCIDYKCNGWFILKSGLFVIGITALLSMYWVIPFIASNSEANDAVTRGLFGSTFWTLRDSIALHHPFWSGSKPIWFVQQPISPVLWLTPILAFFGLFVSRTNKKVLFFGILAITGIFLGKQINEPFTGTYPWLFSHLPGFNAFRESTKFYFFTALAYSVLISALVAKYSFGNLSRQKHKWVIFLTAVVVIGLSLINVRSFISGKVESTLAPRSIPADYIKFNNFVSAQKYYFRTFWLPSDSRWALTTNMHPVINASSVWQEDWSNIAGKIDNLSPSSLMTNTNYFKLFPQLFDNASVKYLVVPIEDKANDDNFFIYYGNRTNYIKVLDSIHWLKRVDIGTKELVIYENMNYLPHVSAVAGANALNKLTNRQLNFASFQSPKQLQYASDNPTKQSVQVYGTKGSFILNFAESFNAGWKLYLKPVRERQSCNPTADYRPPLQTYADPIQRDSVIQPPAPGSSVGEVIQCKESPHFMDLSDLTALSRPAIFDSSHIKLNGFTNGWTIDPAYIKAHYSPAYYHQNPDGSIDVNMDIYFLPQTYLYFGLVISGATLAACIGYLGYDWRRRHRLRQVNKAKSFPE